jgi:hypothetical protein
MRLEVSTPVLSLESRGLPSTGAKAITTTCSDTLRSTLLLGWRAVHAAHDAGDGETERTVAVADPGGFI